MSDLKQEVVHYITFLLSRRMYTEQELRDRIQKKFENVDFLESLIEDMKQKKFIDDELFVKMYLEYEIRTNFRGKMGYWQKLFQRGIEKSLFETIWKSLEVDEMKLAKQLLENNSFRFRDSDTKKRREKIQRYLLGRGFDFHVVINVIL